MLFTKLLPFTSCLSRRPRTTSKLSGVGRLIRCRPAFEELETRSLLSFTVTDLGAFTAYGMNNVGQVVGYSGAAVLWQNGTLTDLGAGANSNAYAINDAGQAVGYGNLGGSNNFHAFLWDVSHGLTDLGTLPSHPYSQAVDLNESGQVVGVSKQINSWYGLDGGRAFLWDATNAMQDLGIPGSNASTATAINEAGQIVGYTQESLSGETVFATQDAAWFRDSNGTLTSLGTLPGQPYSKALDINDSGQVVGSSGAAQVLPHSVTYQPFEAFLWQNGVMNGLGVPPGYSRSEAVAINNAGQVVCMADPGYYPTYSGHPFLWQDGAWTDLGYANAYLVDINENGQILVAISGGHSYLLTPDTITGLTISNASVTEGDADNVTAVFTLTRSGPVDQTSTVDFTTVDGTARAGRDYVATSGTLTFNPGETTKTISVTVLGDLVDEYDETFSVRLSNPTGAVILGSQGTGTIIDNDPPPTLVINDVQMTEGNSGVKYFVFTVSLSAASEKTITVSYATQDGTATSTTKNADYRAASGTITFNPGETTKTISIAVYGDTRKEATETFFVNLSGAVNADILDGQGLGTIINDD